ncbi:MAG: BRCT domain-containing protein [Campylobacterota bacterium]|nr:BRCT domain-containing protein [Campylobacterota bacterium]
MNKFEDKKIFFSGRGEKIEKDELIKYFIQHNGSMVENIDDADFIIEGYMTPVYLEDKFYLLSQDGIDVINIETIEKEFSKNLNIDNITMAIKISKDQIRLIKLLKNRYFDNDTFLNLLKFYIWGDDGLHGNDENRDISTAIVNRFCSLIESNHNIQHSPIGIYYTALETTNSKLLEIIFNMPEYKISDKNALDEQPLTLKEVVALNQNTPKSVLMQILKNNNFEELKFLALNESISGIIRNKLIKLNDSDITINLIKSNNLDLPNIEIALENKQLKIEVLKNSNLTDELFDILLKNNLSDSQIVYLSSNSSLNTTQIDKLFNFNIDNVNINLLKNGKCQIEKINKFLEKNDLVYNIAIAHNSNLSEEFFDKLKELNDINIDITLCYNQKTPKNILIYLYNKSIDNLNEILSQNENTPINILMQLQVDSRYSTNVANNETYREFSRNSLGIIQDDCNRFKRNINTVS